jgi:hypothetical protein
LRNAVGTRDRITWIHERCLADEPVGEHFECTRRLAVRKHSMGGADVDVERAVAVEGDALVFVLPVARKAGHDGLCGARRFELTGRELHALDRQRMREIHLAVAQRDPGRARAAERFLDFESAIAVRVAQRNRAAAGGRLAASAAGHQRNVQVTIGRNRQMTRGPEVVRHDQRAESRRQREAAIIGIAHRTGLSADDRDERENRHRADNNSGRCSLEFHISSPTHGAALAFGAAPSRAILAEFRGLSILTKN